MFPTSTLTKCREGAPCAAAPGENIVCFRRRPSQSAERVCRVDLQLVRTWCVSDADPHQVPNCPPCAPAPSENMVYFRRRTSRSAERVRRARLHLVRTWCVSDIDPHGVPRGFAAPNYNYSEHGVFPRLTLTKCRTICRCAARA